MISVENIVHAASGERDLISLIAFLLFLVFSLIGSAVKNRFEKARAKRPHEETAPPQEEVVFARAVKADRPPPPVRQAQRPPAVKIRVETPSAQPRIARRDELPSVAARIRPPAAAEARTTSPAPSPPPAAGGLRLARLLPRPSASSSEALRRVFILREIFAPPISLRPPNEPD